MLPGPSSVTKEEQLLNDWLTNPTVRNRVSTSVIRDYKGTDRAGQRPERIAIYQRWTKLEALVKRQAPQPHARLSIVETPFVVRVSRPGYDSIGTIELSNTDIESLFPPRSKQSVYLTFGRRHLTPDISGSGAIHDINATSPRISDVFMDPAEVRACNIISPSDDSCHLKFIKYGSGPPYTERLILVRPHVPTQKLAGLLTWSGQDDLLGDSSVLMPDHRL
ncbi:hypothetical protein EV363DRAFT_1412686 [Boletus edulis]|nr:hypothetical protein EV363DRAFT_1412686 [Boletus edulis]